jgi:hypothetical protein
LIHLGRYGIHPIDQVDVDRWKGRDDNWDAERQVSEMPRRKK